MTIFFSFDSSFALVDPGPLSDPFNFDSSFALADPVSKPPYLSDSFVWDPMVGVYVYDSTIALENAREETANALESYNQSTLNNLSTFVANGGDPIKGLNTINQVNNDFWSDISFYEDAINNRSN